MKQKTINQEQTFKKWWVCIDKDEHIDYSTLSYWRKRSMESITIRSRWDWKEFKKHGWRCVKVDVIFKPTEG